MLYATLRLIFFNTTFLLMLLHLPINWGGPHGIIEAQKILQVNNYKMLSLFFFWFVYILSALFEQFLFMYLPCMSECTCVHANYACFTTFSWQCTSILCVLILLVFLHLPSWKSLDIVTRGCTLIEINYLIKVACYPEFSGSANLESKLIKLFVFVNF